MKKAFSWAASVKKFALAHKFWSTIIVLVFLVAGWRVYAAMTSTKGQTAYVLGTVASGTVVATVSESGQVSSSDSIDIKPQVSGQITWVGVKAGDTVRKGQALMTIDNTDAVQELQDAKNTLATDQLNYQKAQAQAPVDYQNDLNALQTDKENLADDYNTTYNDLSSTYLDLPDVIAGAQNTLFGYDFDPRRSQWNVDALYSIFLTLNPQQTANVTSFRDASKTDYAKANTQYSQAVAAYGATSRTSSADTMDALLTQSISMTTDLAQALQSELNFLGAASDLAQANGLTLPAKFTTVQSDTRTFLSTANSDLSKLLADKKMLDSAKQGITDAEQTVMLDKVGNPDGSNPISLQVTANSIAKEEQDIANQESNLADYTIVAPFAGTLATVDAKLGDTAGSASVATIISNAQIADLSVNEVDAAKLKLGQKATLTFDAIPDLTLTGTVAEINTVGTVSQGVVSYDVKISFDTQDPRVKSGMTVTANIETAVAQETLVVPSSAVKTQGGQSYVQVFDPAIATATAATAGSQGVITQETPMSVPVEVGISDDTQTQILSGLTEGEQIIVRTTTSGTTPTPAASATTRGFGGGGGAVRFGGGGFGG